MELRVVAARESGVVTMIGTHALVAEAEQADCVLELVPALGAFVPAGGPLFLVHGGSKELDEERLFSALSLKLEPTLEEDVAYGMRLLVDIAEQSLSESPFRTPRRPCRRSMPARHPSAARTSTVLRRPGA